MRHYTLSLTLFLTLSFLYSFSQPPFICNDIPYITNNYDKKLIAVDFNWDAGEVVLTPLPGSLIFSNVTAIDYSKVDNYIYGIAEEDELFIFLRIDGIGNAHILDTLDFGIWDQVYVGAISPINNMYYCYLVDIDYTPTSPSSALAVIDLNTSDFEMTITPIESGIGDIPISAFSASFDPITDSLYAYLIYPDQKLGYINRYIPNIDTIAFPIDSSESFPFELFFDRYARLWGIGYDEIDKLDKSTGKVDFKRLNIDPGAIAACSCPYTLSMQNKVSKDTTFGCTEIVYTITVYNLAEDAQTNITLQDSFPEGFTITEVLQNPFGGVVNGIQTDELTISDMTIPFGVDSIILSVLLPEDATGLFYNQASMSNIDLSAGNNQNTFILSDDPRTFANPDPTPLYIIPLDIDLANDSYELCDDSSLLINPFPYYEGLQYEWQGGSTESEYFVQSPGIYSLTITAGCKSDSVYFEVLPSGLSVSLGDDEEIIFGDPIELNASINSLSSIISYEWEIPDTVSCTDCPSMVLQLGSTTVVKLTIKNKAECVATAYKHIQVSKDVFVPNAFSPNMDGINDYFFIQSKNPVSVISLKIFSRWGEVVYLKEKSYSNIPEEGWNGTFNNEVAPPGVYIWVAELEFNNGERKVLKGDVSILSTAK